MSGGFYGCASLVVKIFLPILPGARMVRAGYSHSGFVFDFVMESGHAPDFEVACTRGRADYDFVTLGFAHQASANR